MDWPLNDDTTREILLYILKEIIKTQFEFTLENKEIDIIHKLKGVYNFQYYDYYIYHNIEKNLKRSLNSFYNLRIVCKDLLRNIHNIFQNELNDTNIFVNEFINLTPFIKNMIHCYESIKQCKYCDVYKHRDDYINVAITKLICEHKDKCESNCNELQTYINIGLDYKKIVYIIKQTFEKFVSHYNGSYLNDSIYQQIKIIQEIHLPKYHFTENAKKYSCDPCSFRPSNEQILQRLSNMIFKTNESINDHLNNPLNEFEKFTNLLIKHKALVTGSALLQCVLDEYYENSDIDIYIDGHKALNFFDELVKTFDVKVNRRPKESMIKDIDYKYLTEQAYYRYENMGIFDMAEVEYNNKIWQIIIIRETSVYMFIQNTFDLSFCKIFWNPSHHCPIVPSIHDGRADNILKKIGFYNNHADTKYVHDRIMKYTKRGFIIYKPSPQ